MGVRFTVAARDAVIDAVRETERLGVAELNTGHLLRALAREQQGLAGRLIGQAGVTQAKLHPGSTGNSDANRAGLTDEEIDALRSVGIDADEIVQRVEESFGEGALSAPPAPRRGRRIFGLRTPFTKDAKQTLVQALKEAKALHHDYIGPEHLLLALLSPHIRCPEAAVLAEHGLTYGEARRRLLQELLTA